MMRLAVVAVLSAVLCGCLPTRVSIRPVPDKEAPRAERVSVMKALLPEKGLVLTTYDYGIKTSVNLTSITLRDGTRIEDPADLLPAMEPGSAAARYVASWQRNFTVGFVSGTVQAVMIGVGIALLVAAVAVPDQTGAVAGLSPKGALALVGLGSFVLSWVPYLVARIFGGIADEERTSAFHAYPDSLARRLGLEADLEEAPLPPPAPRPPPSVELTTDVPTRVALLPR